jgi:hypothetical protein
VEPEKGKKDEDEGECCTCDEAKYQVWIKFCILEHLLPWMFQSCPSYFCPLNLLL